jgi:hypothetical protein
MKIRELLTFVFISLQSARTMQNYVTLRRSSLRYHHSLQQSVVVPPARCSHDRHLLADRSLIYTDERRGAILQLVRVKSLTQRELNPLLISCLETSVCIFVVLVPSVLHMKIKLVY